MYDFKTERHEPGVIGKADEKGPVGIRGDRTSE